MQAPASRFYTAFRFLMLVLLDVADALVERCAQLRLQGYRGGQVLQITLAERPAAEPRQLAQDGRVELVDVADIERCFPAKVGLHACVLVSAEEKRFREVFQVGVEEVEHLLGSFNVRVDRCLM